VRRLVALACVVAAAVAAGCGAGGGERPHAVKLTVTDDFGRRTLIERPAPDVGGGDTVMRLLQRNADVETRYGGGFVQAIDGLGGGRENGRPIDWFFFVNGILQDEGAASVELHPGDRVWWDRHDWGVTGITPAVVGSFPEPFLSGIEGKRLSTRLECDPGVQAACDAVRDRLGALGVVAGTSRPGAAGGAENLRVIVGRWPEIRRDRALVRIERGPEASGVFARISRDGRTIVALDARGRQARRLGPGTGLIAATRWRDEAPTWVVTGTDATGVQAAADNFQESVLAEKFALAITADGLPVDLPAPAAGRP
jgi:hypothetical protein